MSLSAYRLRVAHLGDCELMAEVSAGSVESFGDLYDRYCDRAYRVAWVVCRDDGRAQEAVQDGFLAVWKSRRAFVRSGGQSPHGC